MRPLLPRVYGRTWKKGVSLLSAQRARSHWQHSFLAANAANRERTASRRCRAISPCSANGSCTRRQTFHCAPCDVVAVTQVSQPQPHSKVSAAARIRSSEWQNALHRGASSHPLSDCSPLAGAHPKSAALMRSNPSLNRTRPRAASCSASKVAARRSALIR